MRTTNIIDREINQYLPRLSDQQKEAVLGVVKTFTAERQDWWDDISKEQQQAIDKSLAEMKAGKAVPQDEALKKYKKWLKKQFRKYSGPLPLKNPLRRSLPT